MLESRFIGRWLLPALLFLSSVVHGDTPDPLAAKTPEGMVYVPAGDFTMGTNQGDPAGPNKPRGFADAQSQHAVTLPAFYIDKTEVTNAQYKRYCEATGYPVPPDWKNGTLPDGAGSTAVTHVNWWEATAYARWAGKRLPTEAEWEKAARGTDARTFPWGKEWEPARVVWGMNEAQAVGTKPDGASPYGALDMAGNVFEWTADWYKAYPNAPQQFPEYGTKFKVVRGGGFFGFEMVCRTYYRSVDRPASRSEWIGFRCAKDAN